MKLSEVYNKTIDILNESGWIQGYYVRDGCYCLTGAMRRACRALDHWDSDMIFNPNYISARQKMMDKVTAKFDTEAVQYNPITWNDESGRKKEEVIALLTELRDEEIQKENQCQT